MPSSEKENADYNRDRSQPRSRPRNQVQGANFELFESDDFAEKGFA